MLSNSSVSTMKSLAGSVKMDKCRHPAWYYKYYDLVFAAHRDYTREMHIILSECTLLGSRVQEIGAGTGRHSELLLAQFPSKLELVDIDEEAISILKRKFLRYNNINILHADGFSLNNIFNSSFDIVISMFSILQQVPSLDDFAQRLFNVLNRVINNGIFAFEYIDHNINRQIYNGQTKTRLILNSNAEIYVESYFQDLTTTVTYSGRIDSISINYSVNLLNITQSDIDCLVHRLGEGCSHSDISRDRRRKICFVSKLSHGK